MDHVHVIAELEKQYPNCRIIKIPESNPNEVLCEIDPTENHPDYSIAISIIDQSVPHYHNQMTEIYEVITGNLSVFIDGIEHKLSEGDKLTIPPNSTHYAIGNETWIRCTAKPGWTVGDHIMADTDQKRDDN